jgi:hypothetical protein
MILKISVKKLDSLLETNVLSGGCTCKYGHQKDTCVKRSDKCSQILFQDSIINIIGEVGRWRGGEEETCVITYGSLSMDFYNLQQ